MATLTNLAHGICILKVQIFYNVRHLSLQLELMAFLEIQPGCVYKRQQNPVKARLANLNTGSVNAVRPVAAVVHKAFDRCTLFRGRRRRDVGRVKEKF
jgi:hypothetical protein